MKNIILLCCVLLSSDIAYAGSQNTVFVEAPGPCYEVAKVDGARVYISQITSACTSSINVVKVSVDASIKVISVYADNVFYKKRDVQSIDTDSIRGIVEDAEKSYKKLDVSANRYDSQGRVEADKAFKMYQSPDFQARVTREAERIMNEIVSKKTASTKTASNNQTVASSTNRLAPNERVYVFVSSSMPMSTLRAYVADIAKAGDPNISIVMRGFINGMKFIKPTQYFVGDISKKDPQCDPRKDKCEMLAANVMVDPLLFRKYGIPRVPAVLYVPEIHIADPSQSEGKPDNAKVSESYLVSGDASLAYSLNAIIKETGRESLKRTVKRLNEGFYD